MTTLTAEKKFTAGNAVLDYDDDDGSWADLPLTPEEEEGLRRGREDARNGKMLTLEEFMKGL